MFVTPSKPSSALPIATCASSPRYCHTSGVVRHSSRRHDWGEWGSQVACPVRFSEQNEQ
jgi:hypothetical protein